MPSTVGPSTLSQRSSKTSDEGKWREQHRPARAEREAAGDTDEQGNHHCRQRLRGRDRAARHEQREDPGSARCDDGGDCDTDPAVPPRDGRARQMRKATPSCGRRRPPPGRRSMCSRLQHRFSLLRGLPAAEASVRRAEDVKRLSVADSVASVVTVAIRQPTDLGTDKPWMEMRVAPDVARQAESDDRARLGRRRAEPRSCVSPRASGLRLRCRSCPGSAES